MNGNAIRDIDAPCSFWLGAAPVGFTALCAQQYERMRKSPFSTQRLELGGLEKGWEPSKPKRKSGYQEEDTRVDGSR